MSTLTGSRAFPLLPRRIRREHLLYAGNPICGCLSGKGRHRAYVSDTLSIHFITCRRCIKKAQPIIRSVVDHLMHLGPA